MTDSLLPSRIALIGGGKMGEAILGGLIASNEGAAARLTSECFTVVNPGAERQKYLTERYGVSCVSDASQLQDADMVVLAVKPQVMPEVLPVVSNMPQLASALFVSIAAGLSTQVLEAGLPSGVAVVRTMPNTPLLVGCGATALCSGSFATEEQLAMVSDLFACLGSSYIVDEEAIDVIGAVSGSGPAYVAALIEAMVAGAQEEGLDPKLAEALATQTVAGTARLMLEKNQSAERTRIDVCSPGGTTLAALDAMEEGGFSTAVQSGVAAAVRRSRELGAS